MAQTNPIPVPAEMVRLAKLEGLGEPIQQKMLGDYATGAIDVENTVYRVLADVRERYAALERTYEAGAGERAIQRREEQERIQNQDLTQGPTYVLCGPDGQPLAERMEEERTEAAVPSTPPVNPPVNPVVSPVVSPVVNPTAASEDQDEEESPSEGPRSAGGTADSSDDQQQGKQAQVPHRSQHLSVADEHEIREEEENGGFIEPDNAEDFDYEES